jgi:glycosyltransferase involved in cell wall biosynthesis
VPKKGYDLLLRAADPAYDLVFVGSGSDWRDGRPTSGDGVHFLGALSQQQVARVYRACDVFALPSTTEGFPLTVQEAMASGLPLVTTDDPGYAPYGLDRAQVSLLPRDADVLRAELSSLVKDQPRRKRMGVYSRTYAERSFAWVEHARTLLVLYTEAGSPRRARTASRAPELG